MNNGKINCCLLGCQGKYNDVTDCARGFNLRSLTFICRSALVISSHINSAVAVLLNSQRSSVFANDFFLPEFGLFQLLK